MRAPRRTEDRSVACPVVPNVQDDARLAAAGRESIDAHADERAYTAMLNTLPRRATQVSVHPPLSQIRIGAVAWMDRRRSIYRLGGRSRQRASASCRGMQLLARRTSPLFREGLRDVQRNRLRVRERNVGHHGDDEPAFGKRHEGRRATDELLFAAMARHPRGLARKRMRLDLPAKAVAGLLARGQPLRRLEQFEGVGLQQACRWWRRPIPNRTRSDGVDRNAAAPA